MLHFHVFVLFYFIFFSRYTPPLLVAATSDKYILSLFKKIYILSSASLLFLVQQRKSKFPKTCHFNQQPTDAAKGHTVELHLQPLHVPKQLDTGLLQLQLRMLGDITKDSPCNTVPEMASCLTKLHQGFVQRSRKPHKAVPLSYHISGIIRDVFSTLRRLKSQTHCTMTQKRLTHLTVMHVHSNILQNLNIHILMKDFISITPERKSTYLSRHQHCEEKKSRKVLLSVIL